MQPTGTNPATGALSKGSTSVALPPFQLSLSYFNHARTSYETSLHQIDEKLEQILNPQQKTSIQDRGVQHVSTQELYREAYNLLIQELQKCPDPEKPPVELAIRFCDVLSQFGKIVYSSEMEDDNNYKIAQQMEFAALNAGDYAVGISDKMFNFSKGYEKIDDFLRIDVSKHKPFEFMDKQVLEHSVDYNASRPDLTHLSPHGLFVLAFNRRWLNGACRNCEDNKESVETRRMRYTNLIMTADRLLNIQFTQETKNELYELDYNDKPGYFKFLMANDPANRHKWKEAYDRNWEELQRLAGTDLGLLTRCLNKMSFDIEDPAEREVLLRKTYDMHPAKDLPVEEKNIHFCIVANNLARTIMDQKPPKLEEADKLLSEVKKVVDFHRKNHIDNVNFPIFDINCQLIQVARQNLKVLEDIKAVNDLAKEAIQQLNSGEIAKCKEFVASGRSITEKYPTIFAFVALSQKMQRIEAAAQKVLADQQKKAEKH